MCPSKRIIVLLCLLVLSLFFISACANDQIIAQNISVISSDDPQIGFWVALHAEENTVKTEFPFTAEISFGTAARNLERFIVSISAEDFEVTKNCPDEYVIDGQNYCDEDFYVTTTSKITPNDLPQCFTISLSPRGKKEVYSGSVEIVINEYMVGGYSTGTVILYYYGNSNLICFNQNSKKEAEGIFNAHRLMGRE